MINWWVILVAAVIHAAIARALRISPVGSIAIGVLGAVSAGTLSYVTAFLRVFAWWSGFAWGALLAFAFGGIPLVGAVDRRLHRSQLWRFGAFVLVTAATGVLVVVWR